MEMIKENAKDWWKDGEKAMEVFDSENSCFRLEILRQFRNYWSITAL